jgi:hypothetical protein
MRSLGTILHAARYPVKSMRGEELRSAPVGLQGVLGDRICAFAQTGLRSAFPWLTRSGAGRNASAQARSG